MIDASLHRLHEFLQPDDAELEAFSLARKSRLTFRRRQVVTTQGDPVSSVYLLVDGWAQSSFDVASGRQMVDVHLPGDFLGLPSMSLTRAAETITALTAVTVDVIPIKALAGLFDTAPRLALAIFLISQQERVRQMDHLAAVGRTSAMQRLCGLLLYIHSRLKAINHAVDDVIDWPLSQEHIAQGAGLSSVHVNRTLRELERGRLIEREGKRIRLLDLERISDFAGLPARTSVREPGWLTGLPRRAA